MGVVLKQTMICAGVRVAVMKVCVQPDHSVNEKKECVQCKITGMKLPNVR